MRIWSVFLFAAAGTFLLDQGIKQLFLDGYQWHSRCVSLELHINHGAAFSLFAFLGPVLKWIQLFLVGGLFIYLLFFVRTRESSFAPGLLTGAAVGNLYDRFVHGGVIDYFYWHCGFDFAVFNYADVMIDISVLWLFWRMWRENDALQSGRIRK